MIKGVRLKVSPEDAKWIRFDIIRSFDRPLINAETVSKIDISLATSSTGNCSTCSANTSTIR